MTEKTWTQEQVDAIANEVLKVEGLTDEQIAEGRAKIESKYGLSPGTLSKIGLPAEKVKVAMLGAKEKKVGTFGAFDHWPYWRPVDRPKENIPEVFTISEALRPKKQDSSSAVTSEKKKPKEKSAREIYTENFQKEQAKKQV